GRAGKRRGRRLCPSGRWPLRPQRCAPGARAGAWPAPSGSPRRSAVEPVLGAARPKPVLSPTCRPLFIIQQAEHFILGAARLALLARDKHAEILVERDLDRGFLLALLLALLLVVGVVRVLVFVAFFFDDADLGPVYDGLAVNGLGQHPFGSQSGAIRGNGLIQHG